jgi:hypothetical protein
VDILVARCAAEVRHWLLGCTVAHGLQALREATLGVRWAVVSGGARAEMREVFAERELIEGRLDDLEDFYLANATMERVRKGQETIYEASDVRESLHS